MATANLLRWKFLLISAGTPDVLGAGMMVVESSAQKVTATGHGRCRAAGPFFGLQERKAIRHRPRCDIPAGTRRPIHRGDLVLDLPLLPARRRRAPDRLDPGSGCTSAGSGDCRGVRERFFTPR